jgi:hypothetical protein
VSARLLGQSPRSRIARRRHHLAAPRGAQAALIDACGAVETGD